MVYIQQQIVKARCYGWSILILKFKSACFFIRCTRRLQLNWVCRYFDHREGPKPVGNIQVTVGRGWRGAAQQRLGARERVGRVRRAPQQRQRRGAGRAHRHARQRRYPPVERHRVASAGPTLLERALNLRRTYTTRKHSDKTTIECFS